MQELVNITSWFTSVQVYPSKRMCSLPIRFSCLEWFLFSVSRCERARHAKVSQHHFLVYFRTGIHRGKNMFSFHQILFSRFRSLLFRYHLLVHMSSGICERTCSLLYDAFSFYQTVFSRMYSLLILLSSLECVLFSRMYPLLIWLSCLGCIFFPPDSLLSLRSMCWFKSTITNIYRLIQILTSIVTQIDVWTQYQHTHVRDSKTTDH